MSLLDDKQELKNKTAVALMKNNESSNDAKMKALSEMKLLVLADKKDGGILLVDDDNHQLLYGAYTNKDFDTQMNDMPEYKETVIDFFEIVRFLYDENMSHPETHPTDVFLIDEAHVGLNLPFAIYMQTYDSIDPLKIVNINDTAVSDQVKQAILNHLPKDTQVLDNVTVYLDYRESQVSPTAYHIVFGRHTDMIESEVSPIISAITQVLSESDDATRVDKETISISNADAYMDNAGDVDMTPIYVNDEIKLPNYVDLSDIQMQKNSQGMRILANPDLDSKTIYSWLKSMAFLVTTTLPNNEHVTDSNFEPNGRIQLVDKITDKHGVLDVYISNGAFEHYAEYQSSKFSRDIFKWPALVNVSYDADASDETNTYVIRIHDDENKTLDLDFDFVMELADRFGNKTPLFNLIDSDKYDMLAKAIRKACLASPELKSLVVLYEYGETAGKLYFVSSEDFSAEAITTLSKEYLKLCEKFEADDIFTKIEFINSIDYFVAREANCMPMYKKHKKFLGLF